MSYYVYIYVCGWMVIATVRQEHHFPSCSLLDSLLDSWRAQVQLELRQQRQREDESEVGESALRYGVLLLLFIYIYMCVCVRALSIPPPHLPLHLTLTPPICTFWRMFSDDSSILLDKVLFLRIGVLPHPCCYGAFRRSRLEKAEKEVRLLTQQRSSLERTIEEQNRTVSVRRQLVFAASLLPH